MSSVDLREYPFYRARLDATGRPEAWSLEDLEAFASGRRDPFAGRLRPGVSPPIALQIEASGGPLVWTAMNSREMDVWASGLARIWARWGLRSGETIAFFEYGSSPLVLLSSSSFVASLKRGAADRLGATAICNDGVASLAARMASLVELVRPAALVLRRDVLAPFSEALRLAGVNLSASVRWASITEPEGAPARSESERFAGGCGIRVYRWLRADAAFILAGDCEECGFFHFDPRLYCLETLSDSEVAVTSRFASLCPAARYRLSAAELAGSGCPREPRAERVRLLE